MAEKKHLDGTGKGVVLYDPHYDILTFKIKGRLYKKSIEFQNFVLDIDDKDFVTGVRIFDASKVFQKEKDALNNIISFDFKAAIEDNIITIMFTFISKVRNKGKEVTQQITAPIAPYHLSDCLVECQAVV